MVKTVNSFTPLFGDKRLGHNHQHHLHHHHHQDHQSPDQLHQEHHQLHHHSEHQNAKPSTKSKSKSSVRKGKASPDFSEAVLDEETGLNCVKTEKSILKSERESLLTCRHSAINICHYSYVTRSVILKDIINPNSVGLVYVVSELGLFIRMVGPPQKMYHQKSLS